MPEQPALSPVKQALAEIRELRGRLDDVERAAREPIAIVGMAGRFPGAANVDELWTLLHEGRIAIDEVPPDRWDAAAFFDPDQEAPGKMSVRRGGFLPGVDRFDPHFFGISPREAVSMDPQQRLLLETSWRALEDAGISPAALSGTDAGVFVGLSNIDYYRMAFADREAIDAYFGSGTSGSVAAGRLSYVLGLRGPSLTIDTACSSSLVAIHLAVQSLRRRECDTALAGGVNLILTPDINIACSKAKMMAPDGLCKTFDARADGYVRSEGCAVVVLERLSDAQRAGNRVLAIIRGTAVNQDGRSGGLTVPNGPAQEAVVRRALQTAGVAPHQIGYVEAHGTGTSLGDPIEVGALGRVFLDRAASPPLPIGSIKSNIGHLESAAGVAGLVKVVLALDREEIPGHPGLGERSPHIDWDALPLDVPAAPRPWLRGTEPRIAGVSSFGFSGTNAHLVVEEAPAPVVGGIVERTSEILTISARTPEALEQLCGDFESVLRSSSDPLPEICATANAGRLQATQRVAAIGASAADMADALASTLRGEESSAVVRGTAVGASEPVFLFTGQGSQYAGMARTLYETHPPFQQIVDRCAKALEEHLERPLLDVLFGGDADTRLLHDTAYAQPALFAVEYALAETWMSWGVRPAAVAGHSVGELVAACVAGVFTLEDGLRLIAARGRLMQALADNGAMVSVFADARIVRQAIAGRDQEISIAALNGPEQVVISGLRRAIGEAVATLEAQGIRTRDLGASRAFHSPLLDPMLDGFGRAAASIALRPPAIPVFSNLTGARAGADLSTAAYWVRHAREPVRFDDSIRALRSEGRTVFLEIGPAPTLVALARRFADAPDVQWLHSLRQGRDDWSEMFRAVAHLYVGGAAIDWRAVDAHRARRRVRVPGHPFARQRYWLANDGSDPSRASAAGATVHPLLGRRIDSPVQDTSFEQRVGAAAPAYLADHRVFDSVVFPATGYLEMALAAGRERGEGAPVVENLVIAEPLVLPESGDCRVHSVLTPRGDDEAAFQVFSRRCAGGGAEWHLHASATIRSNAAQPPAEPLAAVRSRCTVALAADEHYALFARSGLAYGASFRGITELWQGASEAIAAISLPPDVDVAEYTLHPAMLDSCFHALLAALPGNAAAFTGRHFYLPVGVDRAIVSGRPGARAWAHARLRPLEGETPEAFAGDIDVFDETGTLVAAIAGLTAKRATPDALHAAIQHGTASKGRIDWFYSIQWQPMEHRASPELPAGSWLVLDDDSALGTECAERLRARGDAVVRAPFAPASIDAHVQSDAAIRVLCVAPELRETDDAASAVRESLHGVNSVLSRLSALRTSGALFERVVVLTRGACGDTVAALSAEPIASFVASLGAEHADLPCSTIDVDVDGADAAGVETIWNDLVAPDTETRIACSGGGRRVARLRNASVEAFAAANAASGPVSLAITERGILDNLKLVPAARRAPGPAEVEIEVAAAGLNFRDVLNALGMYPGNPGALGNECVGRVSAVGSGVTSLRIGQRVMALVHGGFQSFAVAPADWVVEIPEGIDDAAAATIPMAFATAEYSLNRLAHLRAGERVLIHAASGGVGLAAVQLASRAGAEIFATAGSDEKRALLRALGVRHVMNSRTLAFADEILAATDGEGVDVVLNSLTGDAIPKSLSALRNGGRFCEIGKRGIWSIDEVAAVRPDVSYFKIFLAEVDDALIQEMLRTLASRFAAGELEPLRRRVFPLEDAAAAFRHMAQARHVGKVVLACSPPSRRGVRGDASYLVTGGSAGLGLRTAEALVARGARHVVLAGRREPGAAAREAIARMEAAGATVTAIAADVSRSEDVARLFAAIGSMPPLAGVVHAAGVRDDGLLASITREKLDAVLAPKLAGAWNVHRATEGLDLDFFVLFSSAASVLPSPGQSNYAAANAFLDALARYRRARGLAAISVNWGPWDDVGMAAGLAARDRQRWLRHGVSFIRPDEGIRAFERVLDARAAQLMVVAADWAKFSQEREGGMPLLADLAAARPERKAATRSQAAAATLQQQLDGMPAARRRDAVFAHVREQVRQVLALDAGYVFAPSQGLRDAGMDSLMALELRNRLQRTTGASLPATLTFDRPTVEALAAFLCDEVLRIEDGAAAAPIRLNSAPAPATAAAGEAIAIVGLACRVPGAADADGFWRLLRDGVDAISEVPRERWDVDAYYDPDPEAPGKMYTRRAGFIDGVDEFDPSFFGISPREAISLDPQQRLLLEVAWEALEDAGQAADRLLGTKSGVFVGIGTYDYALLHMKQPNPAALDAYYGTGTSLSVAAGRIAYSLGLHGPALSIDTACSSSLVAVHLACKSLREGECRLALAGGVNLMLTPEPFVNGCRARMLAPDGACKTFDAAANGYVRAEGAGVVVLKRLADAVADGDRVLALVRGSAVNQDGRSSGLTVPHGPSQQAVIREALDRARVSAAAIDYVEAHGTGTALGDPIEMEALRSVLTEGRDAAHPLVVGSVKTNVGHLEAAAGVTGLIKVVLALQHREIPKSLHFTSLNPHIALDGTPIEIATAHRPWAAAGRRRLAGVSSFGFSGTNAHLIVEEAPDTATASAARDDRPIHVLPLSAKSAAALAALAARFADHLDRAPDEFADIAATAAAGRSHFEHRLAVRASSRDEARDALRTYVSGGTSRVLRHGVATAPPAIAMMFTGQGAQYPGMARQLYETQPVFRAALAKCDALLRAEQQMALLDVLFSDDAATAARVHQTAVTQPALFAVEYALAELWQSWGIRPAAVIGHSVGEYVAAVVAGVFQWEDGLRLIAARAGLMQSAEAGAMAAVFAAEADVFEVVRSFAPQLSIAAVNGPSHTVISGTHDTVDAALALLSSRGISSQRLAVSHAFHSGLMDPILDEFERIAARTSFSEPALPIVSNLTGRVAGADIVTPNYWRRHLREPVRFADGVAAIVDLGCGVLLEVGPKPTLTALGRRIVSQANAVMLPSLRPPQSDWEQLAETVACLYAAGCAIDWTAFDAPFVRRKVALPTYPFQRQRYWLDGTGLADAPPRPAGAEEPGSFAPLYKVSWIRIGPGLATHTPKADGHWLIIGRSSLCAQLAEAVTSVGATAERLTPVDAAASAAPLSAITSILFVVDDGAEDAVNRAAELTSIARSLASRGCRAPLWIVTRGAHSIDREAQVPDPVQAAHWGLGRTIAVEHPDLWGGLLDLDSRTPATAAIAAIVESGDEDQIAVRDGQRYVPRLTPEEERPAARFAVRSDASYLITGGLGSIGLAAARWLAQLGARHLVLAGRTGLPPRDTWDAIGAGTDLARRIEGVRALEALGATVHVEPMDIGDRAAVLALVKTFDRSRPPLAGVFHAAAAMSGVRVEQMQTADLDAMFAPKVGGATALAEATRGLELDCFVLFSSIAALVGTADLGHYAAANAWLDAFAEQQRASGRRALSVNWGPWATLRGSARHKDVFSRSGMRGLEPDAAFAALGALLARDAARAVVASVDWATFVPVYEARRRRPFLDMLPADPAQTTGPAAPPALVDELAACEPGRRLDAIVAHVRGVAAAVLGLPVRALDVRRGFFDLGMDSLLSVELRSRLERSTGIPLPTTLTFKYPTVAAVADFLLSALTHDEACAPAGTLEPAPHEDDLSEDELAKLLASKLAQMQHP